MECYAKSLLFCAKAGFGYTRQMQEFSCCEVGTVFASLCSRQIKCHQRSKPCNHAKPWFFCPRCFFALDSTSSQTDLRADRGGVRSYSKEFSQTQSFLGCGAYVRTLSGFCWPGVAHIHQGPYDPQGLFCFTPCIGKIHAKPQHERKRKELMLSRRLRMYT